MEENLYETTTDLLSVDNLVSYAWIKVPYGTSFFKPEGSSSFVTELLYGDRMKGEQILSAYSFSRTGKKIPLKKGLEYRVDRVGFINKDKSGNELSIGTCIVIYRPEEKIYYFFLYDEDRKVYLPLLRLGQVRKLFKTYQNEVELYL